MRILLVDAQGDLLEQALYEANEHYVVDTATNSDDGEFLSGINEYDAVVVGPTISETQGLCLCKAAKEASPNVPIAFIPDRIDPNARVSLLDAGADVCLDFPVSGCELDAQIRALIRRSRSFSSSIIQFANIVIDTAKKTVGVGGNVIYLRKKEYDLLEYLLINRGRVVTKENILEHVWEEGIYSFSNNVEVHVRNLRLSLKRAGSDKVIKTVRGFGYTVDA